ncbi:hypothetical protein OIU79_002598 [Salix purpurea]|uniref:Uncharacterized protein n=1 Tax=Salix purpurea TaxID=77065 RepID=A0A9Q0ZEE3_SALPP|nr:hypothetical protein OIU79_002598 [Salix purpurea]
MVSISLPKHSLPSLLPTHKPRNPSSQNPPILSMSSQSQFHGLKFSQSSSLSIPSSSSSSSSSSLNEDYHFRQGEQRTGAIVLHIERSGWKHRFPLQVQREACGCLLLPC